MVTVSTVASSDSTVYSVTATGILTFQMIHTILNNMQDIIYALFPAAFGKSHSHCLNLRQPYNATTSLPTFSSPPFPHHPL